MEIQIGGGVFELGNPEGRRAQRGRGGQKTVPYVVGVWIFSGIIHLIFNFVYFLNMS